MTTQPTSSADLSYHQRPDNLIPYPQGVLRLLFRAPLWLHRVGLGALYNTLPFLVLTTKGRKSGLSRHTVLEYRRHGSKYYVVSGWGERPNWFQNLRAEPIVTVQQGTRTFSARAVLVDNPAEALRAVYMFRRNSFIYERILASMSSADTIDLRTLTDVASEFTVVRLEPMSEAPVLQGVTVTQPWLVPALSLLVVGAVLLNRLRQTDDA
jgi:deazaflavin-dependent oxidoreductase (nitroreductase family)